MASDSDSGWETTSSSKSDPELKEVKKYGKTLKRDREKALEESNSKVEEPKKPSAPKEMDLDCEQLDKRIRDDPDIKLGFVIYRTTYKSQEDWDRFMAHVKERIRLNFEGDGAAHLYDRIEWCVQDDPALARASSTKVRRYVLNADATRDQYANSVQEVQEMDPRVWREGPLDGICAFQGVRYD